MKLLIRVIFLVLISQRLCAQGQHLFSLAELKQLATCPDQDCFKKAARPYGYQYKTTETVQVGSYNNALHEYFNRQMDPYRAEAMVFHVDPKPHNSYVIFATNNPAWSAHLQASIEQSGFKRVNPGSNLKRQETTSANMATDSTVTSQQVYGAGRYVQEEDGMIWTLYRFRFSMSYICSMNYALKIQEDLLTLQTTEKKQTKAQYRDYVRFLRLLKSGETKTQQQAAQAINLTLRQAQRVWKNYQLNGLHKLISPTQSTYIGKLSTTQISHLRRFLLDDQASTLTDIKDYIAGSLGVDYTIGGVFDLCKRLGIKTKTGRPVHAHQPQGAVETYKKSLVS